MKKVVDILILAAAFMCVLPVSCSGTQMPDDDTPLPSIDGEEEEIVYEKDENAVRIVSYNVGAFSKYLGNSTSMVAAMMKEIEADAMILNELDRNNRRHDTDQLADFAAAMGWNCYFAKAMDYQGGEYGNGAACSKDLKVSDCFVIALIKETGSEDRSCVVVEFEDFVLAGTHLEVSSENDRIRGIQTITEELTEKYGDGTKPVFLCGDMNAEPSSQTIAELKKNWTQISSNKNTYPSSSASKCIDFIFALKDVGSYTVSSADVLLSFQDGNVKQASDHLPVYVDVILTK